MDYTEDLLKELTEAHGVPGYEAEVRAVVRRRLEPLGTLTQDRMGSVVCCLGREGPKVMLAGHMDEIGFIAHHVTDEGFLRFHALGGWWDQVLLGHRVVVKTRRGDVPGVIGAKPPHLLSGDERSKVVEKKDMYIDLGVGSRAEAEELGVRPGDPVVPQARFQVMGNGKAYLSKAWDDRVGVALMIDALRHFAEGEHPNILYGVATVQEEVGSRGARTSAEAVAPDVGIILESDICGDVPGIKPEESSVKLGGGPSLILLDGSMIPNLALRDLVIDTARELQIPLQFTALPGAGTDGAQVHLHGTGVPTVVMGVPARHIHTHSAILHREDYDRALRLLVAVVARLDAATVAGLTR